MPGLVHSGATMSQGPDPEEDDVRDSAPGIFVFLLGVLAGNLNGAAVVLLWQAIARWWAS